MQTKKTLGAYSAYLLLLHLVLQFQATSYFGENTYHGVTKFRLLSVSQKKFMNINDSLLSPSCVYMM